MNSTDNGNGEYQALLGEIRQVAQERIRRAGYKTQRELVQRIKESDIPSLAEPTFTRALGNGLTTRDIARALDRYVTRPTDTTTFEEYRDRAVVMADRKGASVLRDAAASMREDVPAEAQHLLPLQLHFSLFRVRSGADARRILTTALQEMDPRVPFFSLYSTTGRFDIVARYWTTGTPNAGILPSDTHGNVHERLLGALVSAKQMDEHDATDPVSETLVALFGDNLHIPIERFATVSAKGRLEHVAAQLVKDSDGSVHRITHRQVFTAEYAERRGLHRQITVMEMPSPSKLWPGQHETLYRRLEESLGDVIEVIAVNRPQTDEAGRVSKGYVVLELLNSCAQHKQIHELHRMLSFSLKEVDAQQTTLDVFDIVESIMLSKDRGE